ncbi:MAG: hypothetical protein A2Z07_13025 [Armatimonadetes bacterium RBG_16_67_12]|nr:MAG: hypothetical protein A2Z07_13025 [Armatimonadetes bacterium RBG_16_67_12]
MLEASRQWLTGLTPAQQIVGIVALTALPWIELRGSIPLAIALGWDPVAAGAMGIIANWLIIVPGYFFLDLFYERWFSRFAFIRRLVKRVREKGAGLIERYELLGLALFVGVPLPGTGAYAGVTLAWLLGLRRWRAMAAVALGVVVAGIAVTLVASGALIALRTLF